MNIAKFWALAAGILVVAVLVRVHAISPYLFYPDSYQSLMVAYNLAQYGSAVGPLGVGGIIYPDFFQWTRPVYPALIALGSLITDPVTAARAINLAAGIASLGMAFLVVRRVFDSRGAGLAAAGLLAISYNHVVWSGYVLTEAIGVLALLVALWQLLRRLHSRVELGDYHDLITGGLLALATLTRYEYAVLLVPWLYFAARPASWVRAVNIAVAYAFVLAAGVTLIRPFWRGLPAAIGETTAGFGFILAGAVMVAVAVWGLRGRRLVSLGTATRIARIAIWLIALLLIAQMLGLPWTGDLTEAPRVFFATDPLIGWMVLGGFTLMLRTKKYAGLALWLLVCTVLLALAYYRVNPAMQRYWTHLLPFLIIPAGFAVGRLLEMVIVTTKKRRLIFMALILMVIVFQTIATYHGLRYRDGGLWQRAGYEYRAAEIVKPHLPPGALLIVATPEPYFLVTGYPTQSISDVKPYFFLDNLPDDQTVAIVHDAAMEFYFPHFARNIDRYMGEFIIHQSRVGEP